MTNSYQPHHGTDPNRRFQTQSRLPRKEKVKPFGRFVSFRSRSLWLLFGDSKCKNRKRMKNEVEIAKKIEKKRVLAAAPPSMTAGRRAWPPPTTVGPAGEDERRERACCFLK